MNTDPRHVRGLVTLLWIMQGLEIGISARGAYQALVPKEGLLSLIAQPWYQSYFGTHGVLVAIMVQVFFLTRYWSFSHNIPVTVGVVLLVTAALGLGLYIVIRSYTSPESSIQTLNAESNAVTAWLTFAATADIVLAISLALDIRKRRTGYYKTDSVLKRVALYGAATGAVTATLVTIQLLIFTAGHMFEDIVFFGLPLGGVYIATFLANLHTRSSLQKLASQHHSERFELSGRQQQSTQVMITSVVVLKHDE
ncbi:hypothetical protein DL93DRAFT_2085632 [Clavulina sp. PMI_390]|nr:hypothetical protein DL93DRAFT_2085632 [Clavulina sp. PMI_390]